jgi:hypothetical protein
MNGLILLKQPVSWWEYGSPSFSHWEMYMEWNLLTFILSLVVCFTVYHATWLIFGGILQDLLLVITWVSPSSELPLTSDNEVVKIQLCMHMFKILSLIVLGLISDDTYHDFNCQWKLDLTYFLFSWLVIGEIHFPASVFDCVMDIMKQTCATIVTS